MLAHLVVGALTLPVSAQSDLNFPRISGGNSVIAISSTARAVVDVEFALYDLNGSLAAAAANPVRYEIEPLGVLTMSAAEIFASPMVTGWVRVTSTDSGLSGALFDDGPDSAFDTARSAPLQSDQLVMVPAGGPGDLRLLRVVNPWPTPTSVNITLFSQAGAVVGSTAGLLEPTGGIEIDVRNLAGGLFGLATARISSSRPVAALSAVHRSTGAEVLINGQPASGDAQPLRVAPHVMFAGGADSTLILSNPTGQSVTVTVSLASETGGPIHVSQSGPTRRSFTLASNASVALGPVQLSGLAFAPTVNGWLRVESPAVSLGAVMVMTEGSRSSAYALQFPTPPVIAFPRVAEVAGPAADLILTNTTPADASFQVVAIGTDGRTLARAAGSIRSQFKQNVPLSSLFDQATMGRAGWIAVESVGGLHGLMIARSSPDMAILEPTDLPGDVGFRPVAEPPNLDSLEPAVVRAGERVRVRAPNAPERTIVLFGNRVIEPAFFVSALGVLLVDVPPETEPGFIDVRLRSTAGGTSDPVRLTVSPPLDAPVRVVQGRAFYQKIIAGDRGLDLDHPVFVPIRNARVEMLDENTGQLFSVASTRQDGTYEAFVPAAGQYIVRVLSRDFEDRVVVADNTSGGAVYSVGRTVGEGEPAPLVATDLSRKSGAFNILEVMRRGNRLLGEVEARVPVSGLTIFWSPENTRAVGNAAEGAIGGTFFDAGANAAYVLGHRAIDSDEFDDAVILHEFAHMVAERFSRDDSVGGPHFAGDILDPRVAWSEGWANFFSAVVRGDALYRDTLGVNGAVVLDHDLEANFVSGDPGGYWSEFAVHSLLWDLIDDQATSADDDLQLDFGLVWRAFRVLSGDAFIYVVTFLDRLAALDATSAPAVEQLARSRAIDYVVSADPTVSNPFPRVIQSNVPVMGEVDSRSRNRANLAQAAHLFAFEVGGAEVSIRLDITGLGPAGNPHANDLDLFLMDSTGRVLARSDRGLDGQSELISTSLPAGRYVVEVRSYYTRASTGELVFNSGAYRLTVRLP